MPALRVTLPGPEMRGLISMILPVVHGSQAQTRKKYTPMKTFKTPHWQIDLPDHWQVEHEADHHVIHDPQGRGELQLSATCFDEPVSGDMLYDMAAEHLQASAEEDEVELGDFVGITLDYEAGGEYWQEWYLMSGRVFLFATYGCDLADEGSEADIIATMLESLRVTAPGPA